jgi:hypothetical protein
MVFPFLRAPRLSVMAGRDLTLHALSRGRSGNFRLGEALMSGLPVTREKPSGLFP